MTDLSSVACELCQNPTPMIHTKRCDRCWELERRLIAAPDIARQILGAVPADAALTKAVADLAELRAMNEGLAIELETQKAKNAKFKQAAVFLQNVADSAIARRLHAHVSMDQWDGSTARAVAEAALASMR